MQLKQEDVLNDNIVLTDINPVSNTKSIDDSSTGEDLQQTISRIWESINNKLTRVVNSVNGRTGVVVLTNDDVGLGKVDNVSYAEIQEWVKTEIEKTFENKKLRLYETTAQVISDASTNDKNLAWTPFYCEKINDADVRACIGFFIWDKSTSSLTYQWKPINTIGDSDNSIWYPTDTPGDLNNPSGKLSVNIYREPEPILYLENPEGIKSESGLRIDKTKLGSKLFFLYRMYDITSDAHQNAPKNFLLWGPLTPERITEWGHPLKLRFNNSDYIQGPYDGMFLINKNWEHYSELKKNDIIISYFQNDMVNAGYLTRNEQMLMNMEPAIGTVVSGPDRNNVDGYFEIDFVTLKVWTNGYGLEKISIHRNQTQLKDVTQIAIKLGQFGSFHNMSGLQTLSGRISVMDDTQLEIYPSISLFAPWGKINMEPLGGEQGGIYVTSDNTLATFATDIFNPHFVKGLYRSKYYTDGDIDDKCTGSRYSDNFSWYRNNTFTDASQDPEKGNENGYGSNESLITMNLNKFVSFKYEGTAPNVPMADSTIPEHVSFTNMSGLRNNNTFLANSIHVFTTDELRSYGLWDGKDIDQNDITGNFNGASGGVSVNVGRFLEITPKQTGLAESYYEGGKVQVRTAEGLTEKVEYVEIDSDPGSDWYRYDDEFYYSTDNGVTKLPVPVTITLVTDENAPADWSTNYYLNYMTWFSTVHNDSPPSEATARSLNTGEFAFVAKGTTAPTWEPNKYYRYERDPFVLPEQSDYKIYRKMRTNRMTIDIDERTLGFDEETGKLKVTGGTGGSKVRYIDGRGCYFDTDDTDQDPDSYVKLGLGLTIVSGVYPADYTIGISKTKETLLEYASAFTSYEYWRWYHDHVSEPDNLTYLCDTDNSPKNQIKNNINNSTTHEQLMLISDKLSDCTEAMKSLISDTHTIIITPNNSTYTYGDNQYVYKNQLRQYLACSNATISVRLSNIFGTVAAITDTEKRERIWQTLCYHFGYDVLSNKIYPADKSGPTISGLVHSLIYIQTVSGVEQFPLDWIFGYFVREVLQGDAYSKFPADIVTPDGHNKVLLNIEPANWSTNYHTDYYVRNDTAGSYTYSHVPEGGTTYSAPTWEANKYYYWVESGSNHMVLTESQPSDWASTFPSDQSTSTKYYVAKSQSSSTSVLDDWDLAPAVASGSGVPNFEMYKYFKDAASS